MWDVNNLYLIPNHDMRFTTILCDSASTLQAHLVMLKKESYDL